MPRQPHKQMRILQALREAQAKDGHLPELTEMARRFGIRYPTLREHLSALEAKGHLRVQTRGPGRSPHITLMGIPQGVPLYGEIAAGLPIGEAGDPEGYLALPHPPGRFALRVRGDSMADRIEEGDVVVLQHRMPERQGEICAVRVGEDQSTLKYLSWSGAAHQPQRFLLKPHNPAFPTLEVAAADLQVDGVYLGLLRGETVQALWREGGPVSG